MMPLAHITLMITIQNNWIFEYISNEFTNIRIYSYPYLLLIRIFEYIRIPIFLYLYSNTRYSVKNIQIFKYIRIFATLWDNSFFANFVSFLFSFNKFEICSVFWQHLSFHKKKLFQLFTEKNFSVEWLKVLFFPSPGFLVC